MTDDLVVRLLAAIEAVEWGAQTARGGDWSVTPEGFEIVSSASVSDRYIVAVGDGGGGVIDIMTAEHIARHDPASVLRRCAADRKIAELHKPTHPSIWTCPVCISDRSDYPEAWLGDDHPCPTLCALAEGYGIEVP